MSRAPSLTITWFRTASRTTLYRVSFGFEKPPKNPQKCDCGAGEKSRSHSYYCSAGPAATCSRELQLPRDLWHFGYTVEEGSRREWHWVIRDDNNKRVAEGLVAKEETARAAVRRELKKIQAKLLKDQRVVNAYEALCSELSRDGWVPKQ